MSKTTVTPKAIVNNDDGSQTRSFVIGRESIPLFEKGKTSLSTVIRKAVTQPTFATGEKGSALKPVPVKKGDPAPSRQGAFFGQKPHPFNMSAIGKLMVANTHHSSCILTKRDSTTGLGLEDETVSDALDDLCEGSFLDLCKAIGDDFWQTGNGYIEVVRDEAGTIVGLHPLQSGATYIWVESTSGRDFHYLIRGVETQGDRHFARFGDLDAFLLRNGTRFRKEDVSEVIHFKQTSSLDRWYGIPDWLSAVAAIELSMAILQHNFDFFNNRGVPEFLLFVTGAKVDDPDWNKILVQLQNCIGLGNGHKSMAINLPSVNIKVQVEKLVADGGNIEATFQAFFETLALAIVSAHRTPPLLAQIVIPGKLGSNNELPNALGAFQALVIGPAQTLFAHTFGVTLGSKTDGLKQGIRGRKSFKFNTILDHLNLDALAATSSSRTPVGTSGVPAGAANSATKNVVKPKPGAKTAAAVAKSLVLDGMRAAVDALVQRIEDVAADSVVAETPAPNIRALVPV